MGGLGLVEARAFWTVYEYADRQQVADLVERLSQRLGIPTPMIDGNTFVLPPDVERVTGALNDLDPEWSKVLRPPKPQP
jgi:hypothetical protein